MSDLGRLQEKSLGELLLQSGRLTREALDQALLEQQRTAEPLGKTLVRLGMVEEHDVLQVLQGLLVVTFQLGGEIYAVEALFVREIIRRVPLKHLPQMPAYIEGLLNHRDLVLPVMNLALRLGQTPKPADDEARIIIVESVNQVFGLSVDMVEAVVQLPLEQIETRPTAASGVSPRYVYGVGKWEHRLITVLHLATLLEEVTTRHPAPPEAGTGRG